MKKLVLLTAVLSVVGLGMANAETAKVKPNKPLFEWTCADFLEVKTDYRPVAVAVVDMLNKQGKIEDAILDLEGVENISSQVRTVCESDPDVPFALTLKEIADSQAIMAERQAKEAAQAPEK